MKREMLRVRPGWWRGLLGVLRRPHGRSPRSGTRNKAHKWRTWLWVGLASAAVFTLGVIGFTHYQESRGALDPIASRIYATLQLFALGGGSVVGPVPWELEVARFAGPVVAGYALVRALAVLFREQIDGLRLQLTRGHVIVAGLGHKGRLVARALLEAGRTVVVIEADERNAELRAMRESGALVVRGDARNPDVLRRAGLDRAAELVALCGGDVVNAEIVAAARELAAGRPSGSLHCVAHLVDPALCLLLTGEELERYGRAPIRIDFVNIYAAGARALLQAHPLFPQGREAASRVAIIGAGATAQHLIIGVARACSAGLAAARSRLPVTVGDADRGALSELADRHPEIARFLDLQPAVDPAAASALIPPEVVFVCPDDDTAAVSMTLRLRSLLAGRPTRIVAVIAHRAGLALLLDGAPQSAGGPSVATFGLLDEACQPDLLLAGTTELLARALHQAYLDSTDGARVTGGAVGHGTAAERRPWAELPEHLRESNRDQAAHVAVKLAAIGDVIGPLVDWDRAQQPFSPEEVETMARLEHDRWATERRAAGWRPGPRDSELKTTPFLVPWDELSEEIRDRDRLFIRQLPGLLASIGLQALRRVPAARSSPTGGRRSRSARAGLGVVEVQHDTAGR